MTLPEPSCFFFILLSSLFFIHISCMDCLFVVFFRCAHWLLSTIFNDTTHTHTSLHSELFNTFNLAIAINVSRSHTYSMCFFFFFLSLTCLYCIHWSQSFAHCSVSVKLLRHFIATYLEWKEKIRIKIRGKTNQH